MGFLPGRVGIGVGWGGESGPLPGRTGTGVGLGAPHVGQVIPSGLAAFAVRACLMAFISLISRFVDVEL